MRIAQSKTAPKTTGESFVRDFGVTIYAAMLDFLRTHRARIETPRPKRPSDWS